MSSLVWFRARLLCKLCLFMVFLTNPVRSSGGCNVACGFELFLFSLKIALYLWPGIICARLPDSRDAMQTCQAKIGRAGSGEGGSCASSLSSPRVFFASVLTIFVHYFLGAWNRLDEWRSREMKLRRDHDRRLSCPCISPFRALNLVIKAHKVTLTLNSVTVDQSGLVSIPSC